MSDFRIHTSLANKIPRAAATPDELHEMAKAAWHSRHVLLVPLDDPKVVLSEMDRAYAETIGAKLYGERK